MPTNENEIIRIIANLKSKKSEDLYGISMHLLKIIHCSILKPLTYLINECLEQGYFPDCLKIAKVIPLFKNGDSNNASNYRPISLLPVFFQSV